MRLSFFKVGPIFRKEVKNTPLSFVPFLGKHLVRNPLLDVICLTRKYKEGFNLSFPSEPRDRTIVPTPILPTVVPTPILPTTDPECFLLNKIGILVFEYHVIGNILDEPRTK